MIILDETKTLKMAKMRRLGMSTEKDGAYSKLIVVCSAILSGFTFGLPVFGGVLTAQVKYSANEVGFLQFVLLL